MLQDVRVPYQVIGDIGTMTAGGKFIGGKKAGNRGSVMVSAEGVRDTIKVVIVPNLLKRLAITPSVVRLTPGQQITFTAEGFAVRARAGAVRERSPLIIHRPLGHRSR